MPSRSRECLAFILAPLVLGEAAARAQPAPDAAGDIIVTAQKREQRLQDVPISMAVVAGQQLADRAIADLVSLQEFVPGFFAEVTPGNSAFYIRGIGSQPGNLAIEQTVGLFVDGVYGGHARQFQAPFLDIERVEVLRGPQGALVGKNTSAGAISIVTARPTFEPEASARLTANLSQGGFGLTGIASGPLGPGVAARLAASYDDVDGYIRNSRLGGREPARRALYARGSLLIESGDLLSVIARVEGGSVDLRGTPSERFETPADPDLVRATGGFPGFVTRDFDDTDSLIASLTADLALGRQQLTLISAYSRYDFVKRLDSDFGPSPVLGTEFAEEFEQFSQEIRLASGEGGPIDWIAGAYVHVNDYRLGAITAIALGPFNGQSVRDFRQTNHTVSLFGQLDAKLGSQLRLIAGLRYTDDRKSARQDRRNIGTVVPTWLATPLSGRRVERIWDPSVTLQWRPDPDAMLYAGWGRGSKAGGFVGAQTTTTPAQFELEPERSETVEAGAKLAVADRRLFLNIALFSTLFRDLQVSSFDAPTAAFITSNAGRARSRGLEADLVWRLADGWRLQGALAYLDASYTDFPGAPCPFDNPGCNPAANNAAGRPLPRSPRWSGSATLFGTEPIGSGLALSGEVGLNVRSRAFLEQTYNPAAAQSPFAKLDARLALEAGRLELAIVGRNLTNRITGNHAFGTPFSPTIISKYIDPPRTILLTAGLRL